jgi:TRAP-type mannitol/chloroaromatic compound transport system permease large subunit
VSTQDIYKGVIPFVIIQIIAVILVFLIPEIATIIPEII